MIALMVWQGTFNQENKKPEKKKSIMYDDYRYIKNEEENSLILSKKREASKEAHGFKENT